MKLVLALVLVSLATATTAYSDNPRSSQAASATAKPVRFVAADGVKLVGRLSGAGDVAVILAHGYSQSVAQDGWQRFVPSLVSQGYMVLTFNFRGFCDSKRSCSGGPPDQFGKHWRDVTAAVNFVKKRGAKKIFLIGASMGGLAVLRVASMPGVDLSGVVSLGTPQWPSKYYFGVPATEDSTPARLRQIDEPKLFVAGAKDVQTQAGGELKRGVKRVSFALEAQRMFAASKEPKELVLLDTSFHSSDLLTYAPAEVRKQTSDAVFRFLSENS